MASFSIFKPDNFVRGLTYSVSVVVVVYFICMFVAPWIQGKGDWIYVQDVWDRCVIDIDIYQWTRNRTIFPRRLED